MTTSDASLPRENKQKEILSNTPPWSLGPSLYENPLASASDVAGFRMEGRAEATFPNGRLRLASEEGTFLFWCPEIFPDDVCLTWDFWPLHHSGLCMFFFAAKARGGEDIFAPGIAPRNGGYGQYHSGDINTLHLAYFRRKHPAERSLHTVNLRKSYGFHLVAQGADPIPMPECALPPYRLALWKTGPRVVFAINDLAVLDWVDDGETYGPVLAGGHIGFRQMAPMIGEYANFSVRPIEKR